MSVDGGQPKELATVGQAEPKYTLALIPALTKAATATQLIWGRDDDFQKVEYAHHYVTEIPNADLVEVHGKHIPTEDSPHDVGRAIREHLTAGE